MLTGLFWHYCTAALYTTDLFINIHPVSHGEIYFVYIKDMEVTRTRDWITKWWNLTAAWSNNSMCCAFNSKLPRKRNESSKECGVQKLMRFLLV